jgi:hypothetical protein
MLKIKASPDKNKQGTLDTLETKFPMSHSTDRSVVVLIVVALFSRMTV